MRRQQRLCGHVLSRQRARHPGSHEIGIAGIVEMLKLAPAAGRKMDAGRIGMMWAGDDAAIGQQPVARCC